MSFWTRLVDTITPWDRQGEVQRRRKREEENILSQYRRDTQTQSAPSQQSSAPQIAQPNQQVPSTNQGFNIGLDNKVNVPRKSEYDFGLEKPKQSFWNKIRDQFDANTEADQWRRRQENFKRPFDDQKPIVKKNAPNIAEIATVPIRNLFRVTTGIGEGASGLYDTLTPGHGQSRATKKLTEMAEKLDKDAKEQGLENLYKVGNVGGEILSYFGPGVATKGGKIGQVTSKLGDKFDDIIRLGDNPTRTRRFISEASRELLDPRNLEQEARLTGRYLGQDAARGEAITPRVVAENVLQSLAGAFLAPTVRGINRIRKGRAGSLADEVVDTATSATGGVPTGIREIDIPVRQGIDIQQPVSDSVPINVRTPDADRPIIRELAGDAPNVTQVPTRTQAVEQRAANRFQNQKFGVPDDRIEGVTPRTPEQPYQYDAEVAATTQDKLVDEYAEFLRSIGEGNGTQLVPDGEGGYIRTSNNVRFGDTKGKGMTKDMWREEAERQLRAGEADPAIQREFDDATNPEIQSLLARGEQAPVEEGRPIKVQQVDSIPVQDRTDVPQGLPETPGTVRATTATAPAKTEAKLVAETQPPTPRPKDLPKSEFDEGGTLPTTNADEGSRMPSGDEGGLDESYERLLASLQENQAAYKAQKKLNRAEKKARKLEQQRIYDELVDQGYSRAEAERISRSAWKGEYTKNSVANFDVDSKEAEAFRKAIDDTFPHGWDRENTKTAFNHLIDPNRTDPLPDGERRRIRQFLQKKLGDDKAMELEEVLLEARASGDRSQIGKAADFMTSSIAAGDISAVGRQGLSGLINHPGMSKGAWGDAMQALKSVEGEKAFVRELENNRYATFISEMMDGKWQTLDDIADEARGLDTGNRLTSWYVNPSNRHYNTYLDSLRLRQKTAIIDRYGGPEGFLKAAEKANPEDPKKWMKAWNDVIDRQSGRGSFSAKGSPTVGDMQVLFSARNLASKFQRLTSPFHLGLLKTNPAAYRYQLQETGLQAAVLGSTLAALHASGIADIENGKIKIGNTRIDITGGFSTIFNTMNKMRKSWGVMHDTSENSIFDPSPGDAAIDYLKNQFAPTFGSILRLADVDWSKGEDKYGNKIDTSWWLQTAPMPAVAKTAVDSLSEGENLLGTARNMGLDALGFNTNTYQSAEDKDKAARAETADTVNAALQSIRDTGLLSDSMINSIDDEDVRDILTGKSDKQLSEDELKKVRNKLVGGITVGTGNDSDSAYRERGEYDKDIAALRLKREMVEAEPNHKPSDIKALDIQIKRSEILRDNDIPFELLEKYQKTGVENWRKLEKDDPNMFQKLWEIDELMTKAGVSYKSGSFTDNKYYQKERKSGGRGGSGGRKLSTDFGKLTGTSPFAPKVREYVSLDQSTGRIPRIKRTNPNIVHTIREGRV